MPRQRKKKSGKATNNSDKERVLKFLTDRKGDGEEYHTKYIAGHLQKQYNDERKLKKIYDSIRQALSRLSQEGLVQKVKKGRDTFWKIPTVKQVDEQVDEAEQELSRLIAMEDFVPPEFHGIQYYLKKENCDKSKGYLSDRLKTMFNAMHPLSFYQGFARRSVTQIRGGIQEKFDFRGNTVTIQAYGTGKVNIYVESSQHPISFEEILFMEEWLDALLQSITGYSFRELKDITTVNWEWAIDRGLGGDSDQTLERFDMSGKYAITVRQFDGMVSRIYLKHFKDGSIKERTEQVVNQEISYPEWLKNSSVMFAGGVSSQFVIRQQFQHEKEMEKLQKAQEIRDNAILMNQALIRKQGLDTEHLMQSVEELAKQLGVKLPKREKKSNGD